MQLIEQDKAPSDPLAYPPYRGKRRDGATPLRVLADLHRGIIAALVFGLEDPPPRTAGHIKPPTLSEVAQHFRVRQRHIRWLMSDPLFKGEFMRQLADRRAFSSPRALAKVEQLVDTAADSTALRAAQTILGEDIRQPSVQVAIQNNVAGVAPRIGYHIAPCNRE